MSIKTSIKNPWTIRIVTFVIIVVGWQLSGYFLNPIYISTPLAIVQAFVGLFQGTGNYNLAQATWVTLEATLIGFGASIIIGLPIGLFMGMFRTIDTALDPYVNGLYVTPRIALVPLIIIWFGIAFNAIVVTVIMVAVFPIIINTYAGVRNISKSTLDVTKVFGVRGVLRFRRVIFPATIPFFMTGLRLGIGQALIGVIVAQMLLALSGLGYLITAFGNYLETAQLMALIIELMILGIIMTFGIQIIEKRLSHWKESERAY